MYDTRAEFDEAVKNRMQRERVLGRVTPVWVEGDLVADLSIINAESNCRPTPNPNVLLEVGFAVKAISWSNILCIYNCEYGKVELLPFDIRTRKPIIYNTIEGIPKSKLALTKAFKTQIKDIIFDRNLKDKYNYDKLLHISTESLIKVLLLNSFWDFFYTEI